MSKDTCSTRGTAPLIPPGGGGLCDYFIGLPETVTKPVSYVLAGNGLFMVWNLAAAIAVKCLAPCKVVGLKTVEEGVVWGGPKIPWQTFLSILAFFKEVYRLHKSEVMLQVWMREVEGQWEVDVTVPKQTATGGSVDSTHVTWQREGWIILADIHSHAQMAPFFSGTDDRDDTGRGHIHGVVGHLDMVLPKCSWRFSAGEHFIPVGIEQIVELPATVEIPLAPLLVAPTDPVVLSFMSNAAFPQEWLAQVEQPTQRSLVDTRGGSREGDKSWYLHAIDCPARWNGRTSISERCTCSRTGKNRKKKHPNVEDRLDSKPIVYPLDGMSSEALEVDGVIGACAYQVLPSGKVLYFDAKGSLVGTE